jgi:ubiquinone/menaquinone biosynthesis C-methylase UbiE
MTSSEQVAAAFNEVAGRYDSVGVDFFTPIGAELVRRAGITAGEDVLDVGCGRGAVLSSAADTGARVTGIDLAPDMVRLTAAAYPDTTVLVGDAQTPEFPPASFDVVTAGLVLFFLPDPPAALRAYRRLLRPGGRVAFTSFAAHDPRYLGGIRALVRHAPEPMPPPEIDPLFASPDSVRDGLLAAGFANPDVSTFEVRSAFADGDHYMRWIGSHGGRQLINRIPEAARPAAFAEAVKILGTPLELITTIRFAMGRA